MSDKLQRLEHAVRELASISTAEDALKLMVKAEAAERYARMAKKGEEAELFAHKIKIDAQTLLGQFLAREPRKNGRPSKKKLFPREKVSKPSISSKIFYQSQQLAKAKEIAPELHEKIRSREVPVRDLQVKLAIYKLSSEEIEKRDRVEAKRATTRWLEAVCNVLIHGTSPGHRASQIDSTLGLYSKDKSRCLTAERILLAGKALTATAKEWEKLCHENKTSNA